METYSYNYVIRIIYIYIYTSTRISYIYLYLYKNITHTYKKNIFLYRVKIVRTVRKI